MSKSYKEFFDELDLEKWLSENSNIKPTRFVYETDANHVLLRIRVYYIGKETN